MRKLHESENHISITAWLNENLEDKKSIKGCCQEVKKVPKTKGIYFWFMKSDGYKVLSKYITINPIEPRYTKKIDGVQYDLVYLGTAGVRNNANGLNSGHLHERLKWHLCDNKSVSALCSGIMSTYRRTIGGLISDDLIANFIQDEIDLFLCENFYIYYLKYPGSFLEVKDDVNSDEGILINVIRPVFNLDKNPNAVNQNHVTYLIQQRRQLVENSSKNRWCNSENTRIKSYKVNKSIDTPKATAILNNNISCVEFIVSRTENIAKVAASIPNLPSGICTIELYSNNRNDVRVYINGKTRKIIVNNRTVSEYFNAIDTKNGNIPKWIIVSNEMNQVNGIIEEITVKVCSVGNDGGDNIIINKDNNKTKPIKTISKLDVVDEENIDNTNSKNVIKGKFYLIPCSNKKIKKEQLEQKEFIMENLEFNNELGKYRIEIIGNLKKSEKSNNHTRKVNNQKIIIRNDFNFKNTTQANKVYSKGRLFNAAQSINWNVNDIKKVYIISALFGIIRADNYIPLYDFAMTDEIDGKKDYAKKYWKKKLDGIIKKLVEDGNVVFNLLSNEYLDCIDKKVIDILKIQTVLGNSEIDIKKNDRNSQSIKRGKWLKHDLNI